MNQPLIGPKTFFFELYQISNSIVTLLGWQQLIPIYTPANIPGPPLMAYELSIAVFGPGTDPRYRSHWAFMINQVGQDRGDLLHTQLLNLERLWYQFEERPDAPVVSKTSEGRIILATLTAEQRQKAKQIIRQEPAPRNGRKRCQDWILDAILSLEVEELVDAGLSNIVARWVGQSAAQVARAAGQRWKSASN